MRLIFPKGLTDPFKVDLLAPLGSAEVKVQPGANAYPIQVPVNGTIGTVTLGVRDFQAPEVNQQAKLDKLDLNKIASMDYTKDETGRPATPATASRRHVMAIEAREYLEAHQLLVFVQTVLQGLIREKPNDPWEYINAQSTAAKKRGFVQTPASPQAKNEVAPSSFAPVPRNAPVAQGAAFEAAVAAAGGGAAAGEATPVMDVMDGQEQTLQKAAASLEKSQLAEKQNADALRENLHGSFVRAANDGRLDAALTQIEVQRLAEGSSKPSGQIVGDGKQAAEKALMESKAKVASALCKAVTTGELSQALREMSPEAELAELRANALSLLEESAENGRLQGVLSERQAMAELNELRGLASNTLIQAGEKGSLLEALNAARTSKQEEDLRGVACSILTKAGQDGSLLKVLHAIGSEDPLKRKAKEALRHAEEDGRFLEALQDAASEAGFELTLKRRDPPSAARPKGISVGAARETHDIENLRSSVRQHLVGASTDGRLGKALKELHEELDEAENVEALRKQAREKLIESSGDGTLRQMVTTASEADVDHDFREGDEAIERSTSQKGNVLRRTKTEVLLKMQDGTEAWKEAKALDKVPKLNLAAAIQIQKRDIALQELYAPVWEVKNGDEVIRRSDAIRGVVIERTTTDCLMRMDDGKEAWQAIEDLQQEHEQVLTPVGIDASDGQEVVDARKGRRGSVKNRTTTDILVLHDDGTEEWYELEGVGRPKSRLPTKNAIAPGAVAPAAPVSRVERKQACPPEDQKKIEANPSPMKDPKGVEAPSPTSPSRSQAVSSARFTELEEKIRVRNERFKIENEALARENERLKTKVFKGSRRKGGPNAD